MITSISLQNFKCFEKQTLAFKPLTLLSGLNGTGKSSVIQALLLLRQSYQQRLLRTHKLALNGDLVHIGTAKDALCEWAAEEIISFALTGKEGVDFGQPEPSKIEFEVKETWVFNYIKDKDVLDNASPFSTEEEEFDDIPIPDEEFDDGMPTIYDSCLFSSKNFYYLQAERVGPRRFFETSDFLVHQGRQIGISGEYAAHFLAIFGKEIVENAHVRHPDAVSLSIKDQVEAWLGEISPGTRINLTQDPVTDTVSLQYTFAGKELSSKYRATNVGFGITYVLPILVVLLAASRDALVIIENPEAHLHPKGQAQMGNLLARAAMGGVQVIVETHSDHVLNGIRVAVHDGKLEPDDVQLHFFQKSKEDGHSQVVSPRLLRNGRIDRWPDGFFDEWDKSLEALLD